MAKRMSRKAQVYLTKIKAASNEYDLKGMEITIKKDTAFEWSEFTRLNDVIEEKRVGLRTDQESAKLKELVFFRAKAELDGYLMMKDGDGYTEEETERQRERFSSIYQIIEEAELEDEYDAWKQINA